MKTLWTTVIRAYSRGLITRESASAVVNKDRPRCVACDALAVVLEGDAETPYCLDHAPTLQRRERKGR